MIFTWDPAKAIANLRKHGVTFEEAKEVFEDPLAIIEADPVHEGRAIIIGESKTGKLLYVVYVELEDDLTRIISARHTTKHERTDYTDGN